MKTYTAYLIDRGAQTLTPVLTAEAENQFEVLETARKALNTLGIKLSGLTTLEVRDAFEEEATL